MSEAQQPQLSVDDIVRLGTEARIRVMAMSEHPSSQEIQAAVDELGMSAVELTYRQQTNPDEVDS